MLSNEPESIVIEELISGLQMRIEGMKEGEERVIYIHPDCGYGTKGALPPNSLLTFTIEIVNAHSPTPQEALEEAHATLPKEIAIPEELLFQDDVAHDAVR